jgi:hypothetical protein
VPSALSDDAVRRPGDDADRGRGLLHARGRSFARDIVLDPAERPERGGA